MVAFARVRLLRQVTRYMFAGVLSVIALGASAQPQGLPQPLQKAWRATGLPASALSLQVQEAGGQPLMLSNATQARNPASVMKMVTTWAGLSALGPDYRWRTAFLSENGGKLDAQGTLQGPLYIKAAGDPMFSAANLWEMLRELRMRGVKNLSEVIVDRSVFGNVAINTGAFDGAGDRPYNASPDAMMIGHGAVRLLFYPDENGKKWVPVIDPPLAGVKFNGELGWRDGVCNGAQTAGTSISKAGSEVIISLSGQATGSCGQFSLWRLALSQQEYFDRLFRMLWRELGGTLAHGITDGRVSASAQPIVWHVSESLSDLIRRINKQSNNVMARILLLSIGAHTNGAGATPMSSSAAVLALLQAQGINTAGWVIENGSGLSRIESVTANGLATMLDQAWNSNLMAEFMSSLAISGVDGTVRRRMGKGDARGMAHLKTGTLRDSRALAGYVLGDSGKRYILVSMVNHSNAIAARGFEDALVEWLASQ